MTQSLSITTMMYLSCAVKRVFICNMNRSHGFVDNLLANEQKNDSLNVLFRIRFPMPNSFFGISSRWHVGD
jgi:hypothetical protein